MIGHVENIARQEEKGREDAAFSLLFVEYPHPVAPVFYWWYTKDRGIWRLFSAGIGLGRKMARFLK